MTRIMSGPGLSMHSVVTLTTSSNFSVMSNRAVRFSRHGCGEVCRVGGSRRGASRGDDVYHTRDAHGRSIYLVKLPTSSTQQTRFLGRAALGQVRLLTVLVVAGGARFGQRSGRV